MCLYSTCVHVNCLFLQSQDESSPESAPDPDSDYIPSEASEDDERNSSIHPQEGKASPLTRTRGAKRHNSDCDATTKDGAKSKDKAGSQVTVESCMKGGKRTWDKRHYCLYCRKPNIKISRHLLHQHRTEKEVAAILSLPPKSKTRIQVLDKLRRKGDYSHNICVLQKGTGQIVTCRKPTVKANVEDFLPCNVCFGFYRKSELWRHEKLCHESVDGPTAHENRVQTAAPALLSHGEQASQSSSDLGHKMNIGVKKDPLICQFGDRLLGKHSSDPSKDGHVGQKVTQLERFLLAAKSLDPQVQTLQDVLVPSKFALALKAAQKACCASTSKQRHESPSLASEVGLSLKAVCDIAIGQNVQAGYESAAGSARDFSDLLDAEWDRSVSRQDRCNETEMMTLAKDVVKLHIMLRSEGEKAKLKLLDGPNPEAYKTLSKILLSQITLFNGRRQSEVAAMPLQTYMNGTNEVANKDFTQYLSPLEKNFIEGFTKLAMRGEEGEPVLVLLTKEMKESLDFLVAQRSAESCILDSNRFVFAEQNSDSHLQASSCLRKLAVACEAKRPETVTSTQMRVHVANLSQIMSLNDNEVDQLAKLMGHDITERRESSCLTENPLLLANMSKGLIAMEGASDVCNNNSEDETDLDAEGE